ncbi:hypothetical protein ACSQ67_001301 [Phaseolus vulgaris]
MSMVCKVWGQIPIHWHPFMLWWKKKLNRPQIVKVAMAGHLNVANANATSMEKDSFLKQFQKNIGEMMPKILKKMKHEEFLAMKEGGT